jgi:molecular chaperone HtpG
MYSNRLDVYREYIQNSTDAIDGAVRLGISVVEGYNIIISIDKDRRTVSIKDNGTGIPREDVASRLLDIGNSQKDFEKDRGFRGIGRLSAIGFVKSLVFKTSYQGESVETIVKLDGDKFLSLINPHRKNNEVVTESEEIETAIGVMKQINSIDTIPASKETHYFEVILEGIKEDYNDILNEEAVKQYISTVAPVGFDHQKFVPFAKRIEDFYKGKSILINKYDIFFENRNQSIYKLYTKTIQTGKTYRTKTKDMVRDVELLYEELSDGTPLYIGWLAITDFAGQISDELMQGIRLRKQNILIGDRTTFAKFFPSEGEVANKMFAGEIHILHPDIIPNAKRDDFEQNEIFMILKKSLTKWAGELNRNYRRGTSQTTSSERKIKSEIESYRRIVEEIESNGITSDVKREELSKRLESTVSNIKNHKRNLEQAEKKALSLDPERKNSLDIAKLQADSVIKEYPKISQKIIDAQYSTKYMLPSSYNRDQRRVFSRVLEVVDAFFTNDTKTADALKDALISELSKLKKK